MYRRRPEGGTRPAARPSYPSTGRPDLGPGQLLALQRTAGNRAVSRLVRGRGPVVQRNWGSTSLEAMDPTSGWAPRFRLINGWSVAYQLETFDELNKTGRLADYMTAARSPLNVAGIYGDRVIASLKTVMKTFDAEFYECMAGLQGNDPDGYGEILRHGGKAVSGPRILASLPQLAVRLLDRGDVPGAGGLLDRLPMPALLDALVVVVAAGKLAVVRNPQIHSSPDRASRLMLAASVADWAARPTDWATFSATPGITTALAALGAGDRAALLGWIANKPELAHVAELGKGVADAGQFAFGSMLADEIWTLIVAAGAGAEPVIRRAFSSAADRDSPTFGSDNAAAATLARSRFPALAPVLADRRTDKKRGLEIYENLWGEYERSRTTTRLAQFRNLSDLHALAIAEADRCNAQVRHMHTLHSGATGHPGGPAPALTHSGLATGIKDWRAPAVAGPWRASEVRYIADLGVAVASMRAVLDAGRRLIVGVLSGGQGSLHPEHYLYVLAHRGDTFICADSDPGNERGALPTRGITYLYYDAAANRLSTAPTDSLFPIDYVPATPPARPDLRFQLNGVHRYQALSVSVLPG